MPIITQLLTDSEYARLKHLLGEDSFFDRGDPNAIALLRRDMDIATRVREISPHFTRNGTNGTGRSSMVEHLSREFGLCTRAVWNILRRLEGRSNGHGKALKFYVTDFAAVQN